MNDLPPGFEIMTPAAPAGDLPPGFQVAPQAAPAPKGVGGVVREQIGNAAQAADDIVRLIADGMTFGYADKLAATMDGTPLDQQRAMTQAARDRAGGAGFVAEVLGGLSPASKLAKGVSAGAKAVQSVPALGRVVANPFVQSAATGAGLGAASAAGHDQDIGAGAAFGFGAGVAGQGLANAVTKVASRVVAPQRSPTTFDDLRNQAQQAYDASEQAGVMFSPQATQRLSDTIQSELANFGYEPAMQPGVAGVLSALDRNAGNNATLKSIDLLRRVTGRLGEPQRADSERAIGSRLVGVIDDFVNNAQPGDAIGGNLAQGVGQLQQARQLYGRAAKGSDIEAALEGAQQRAATTGSGGNVENATRQEMRKLLNNRRGWTPDEEAALTQIIEGTGTRNALRLVGKLSPDAGALPLSVNVAAGAGTFGHSLPLTAASYAAKHIGERMTRNEISGLLDLIAAGGSRQAMQPVVTPAQQAIMNARSPLSQLFLTGAVESR